MRYKLQWSFPEKFIHIDIDDDKLWVLYYFISLHVEVSSAEDIFTKVTKTIIWYLTSGLDN